MSRSERGGPGPPLFRRTRAEHAFVSRRRYPHARSDRPKERLRPDGSAGRLRLRSEEHVHAGRASRARLRPRGQQPIELDLGSYRATWPATPRMEASRFSCGPGGPPRSTIAAQTLIGPLLPRRHGPGLRCSPSSRPRGAGPYDQNQYRRGARRRSTESSACLGSCIDRRPTPNSRPGGRPSSPHGPQEKDSCSESICSNRCRLT